MPKKLCISPAFMISFPPPSLSLRLCLLAKSLCLSQQELPRYGSSVLLSLNFHLVDPERKVVFRTITMLASSLVLLAVVGGVAADNLQPRWGYGWNTTAYVNPASRLVS